MAMISPHISTTDMRPSGGPGMDFERVYGWSDRSSRDSEYILTALNGMRVRMRVRRHAHSSLLRKTRVASWFRGRVAAAN